MTKVQLTTDFYSDAKIKEAYKETNSPLGFTTIWSSLAKHALQTGVPKARKPELDKVSLIVETDTEDAPAFKAMVKNGMITLADANLNVSTVGKDKYEAWYKIYPYRDNNGKKIKVRGKSESRFFNEIRTDEDYEALMRATVSYINSVDPQYVRDAERFLKEGYWREYISSAKTSTETNSSNPVNPSSTKTIDSNKINELLEQS